jgi:hypothetical protein
MNEIKNEKKKYETLIYVLSKGNVIFIAIYYLILIAAGITISIITFANINGFISQNIILSSTVVSIAVALMLCSLQYIRRLYKACIDERIKAIESKNDLRHLGNLLYFLFRPVYAAVFVIVLEFAFLGGVVIITSSDVVINERFLYLCVIISCFIGFSIGRVLDGFESLSTKKIDETFKELGDKKYD